MRLEAVEDDRGDDVQVVAIAADAKDVVAETTAGETEPAADQMLEAEVKLDSGVMVPVHDRLVVLETSQCRIAKDWPNLDGWHSRYAIFAFGAGVLLLFAASIALARRSMT